MSAFDSFVRKMRKAVGGGEAPADTTRPFEWQPAAVPGPLGVATMREPGSESAPASSSDTWKKPAGEAASVVGATIPADVADFAIVYKGAGVGAPAHGYGVDRVAQMLQNKGLSGLDKGARASAVLAALDAAGVSVQEVIHDGLLRYKALVAFEAAKDLEALAARPRNERRGQELKEAIASFQRKKDAEIDALTKEIAAAVASLQRLKARQRAEEDRLQRTVSPFVEALPARVVTMPKPDPLPETKPAAPIGDQTLAPTPVAALAGEKES